MRTLAWSALALLLAATSAAADVDVQASLGFGRRWVEGAATPLAVAVRNTGADPISLRITVTEGQLFGNGDLVQVRDLVLPAGVSRDETLLLPGPAGYGASVAIKVEADPAVPLHAGNKTTDKGSIDFDVRGRSDAADEGAVPLDARTIGVLFDPRGALAGRISNLLQLRESANRWNDTATRVECFAIDEPALRLAPLGLDGIDVIVACDPDASFAGDPLVKDGLLDWVALGGTLVVTLGEHAGQFAASPLAAEMPARFSGAKRAPYAEMIRAILRAPQADVVAFEGPFTELTPTPAALKGDPTWRVDDVPYPLMCTRQLGMGTIVLVPYDMRSALAAAPGSLKTLREIAGPLVGDAVRSDRDDQDRLADLPSTLTSVLQNAAFKPPPLPLVVLGIVLYVVVVGPLDWFVLKRLHKERLTTLTFAASVVIFTVLAYGASLLLFSTGARVDRVVFVDFADGGRDGRELMRVQDVAGYYSAVGSDQSLRYSAPAVILGGTLPGASGGEVGAVLPVTVQTTDPLRPLATLQLAFRSQRGLRALTASTTGATLEAEWEPKGSGVRVTNGLSVDLDEVLVFNGQRDAFDLGPVAAGETSLGGRYSRERVDRRLAVSAAPATFIEPDKSGRPARASVYRLLETLTICDHAGDARFHAHNDPRSVALRKAGIDRSGAFLRGRALIVAFAKSLHVPLPGASSAGDTYVVLRKEISRP